MTNPETSSDMRKQAPTIHIPPHLDPAVEILIGAIAATRVARFAVAERAVLQANGGEAFPESGDINPFELPLIDMAAVSLATKGEYHGSKTRAAEHLKAQNEHDDRARISNAWEYPTEARFITEPEWTRFGRFGAPGVTGESGSIAKGFTSTVYETEVILEHYLEVIWGYAFQWECMDNTSSRDLRHDIFARLRVATLSQILGRPTTIRIARSVATRWRPAFDAAKDLCERHGVLSIGDVDADDPGLRKLLAATGYETLEIDDLPRAETPDDHNADQGTLHWYFGREPEMPDENINRASKGPLY